MRFRVLRGNKISAHEMKSFVAPVEIGLECGGFRLRVARKDMGTDPPGKESRISRIESLSARV